MHPGVAMLQGGTPLTPAVPTFIGVTDDTSDASTYTFTGAAIGVAATDRLVVVGIGASAGGARSVSSVTIGGVTAALINTSTLSADGIAAIACLRVAAGTTANIVVNFSGGCTSCSIGVWNINGQQSDTPVANLNSNSASSDNGKNVNIAVKDKGCAIGVSAKGFQNDGYTWTGASERYDAALDAFRRKSGADYTNSSGADEASHNVTTAFSSSSAGALALASWR